MDDRLNREMGGSTGDNAGISSQGEDREPGESGQNPEIGAFPGDFPPGMTGLVSGTGVPAQAVTDLGEPDEEKGTGKPGTMDLFRAGVVAVSSALSPGVGLRFLAWQAHHLLLLYTQDAQGTWVSRYELPVQFSMYLEDATSRDALDDAMRPVDRRQYNFDALHMEGLLPMVQAETDAHREEIAEGLRKTWSKKLKALGIPEAKIAQALA